MVKNRSRIVPLEVLEDKVSNKHCFSWIKSNIGDRNKRFNFDSSHLENRLVYSNKIFSDIVSSNVTACTNRPDWTAEVQDKAYCSGSSLNTLILCLFIHVASIDDLGGTKDFDDGTGKKLIPLQADINGKRFTGGPASIKVTSNQETCCNVMALPYRLCSEGSLTVLPMTYADAKQAGTDSNQDPHTATAMVTCNNVLEVFHILFQQTPNPDEVHKFSPAELFVVLLQYMNMELDLTVQGGWIKLLTAVGSHVWNEENCLYALNKLCIEEDRIPSFALAIFSSISSLKLGFMSGESHIAKAYSSVLLQGRFATTGSKTARIKLLQSKVNKPSTSGLKRISNQEIEEERGQHVIGSILDVVLQHCLECETQKNDFAGTGKYWENLKTRVEGALQLLLQTAQHNPQVRKIIHCYNQRRVKQQSNGASTTRGLKPKKLHDDEKQRKEIVDKHVKGCNNPKAFDLSNNNGGPRDLSVLIMILTEFYDCRGAKALASLLQNESGTKYLPTGTIAEADLDFSLFRARWNELHRTRKWVAKLIFELHLSTGNTPTPQKKKIQLHRFGMRLSSQFLEMVAKVDGPAIVVPSCWERECQRFFTKLNIVQHQGGSLLRTIVSTLLQSVIDSVARRGESSVVSYGPAITDAGEKNNTELDDMELDEIFLYRGQGISPFDLVLKLFSGKQSDRNLLEMIDHFIKHEDAVKEEKKKAKKAQKKAEQDHAVEEIVGDLVENVRVGMLGDEGDESPDVSSQTVDRSFFDVAAVEAGAPIGDNISVSSTFGPDISDIEMPTGNGYTSPKKQLKGSRSSELTSPPQTVADLFAQCSNEDEIPETLESHATIAVPKKMKPVVTAMVGIIESERTKHRHASRTNAVTLEKYKKETKKEIKELQSRVARGDAERETNTLLRTQNERLKEQLEQKQYAPLAESTRVVEEAQQMKRSLLQARNELEIEKNLHASAMKKQKSNNDKVLRKLAEAKSVAEKCSHCSKQLKASTMKQGAKRKEDFKCKSPSSKRRVKHKRDQDHQ